jgi:hypothetical protein
MKKTRTILNTIAVLAFSATLTVAQMQMPARSRKQRTR